MNQVNDVHAALPLQDVHALALMLRHPQQPHAIFKAIDTLMARVIGHRLFTIMAFDPSAFEVERLYSNMPAIYPPGGRKKKAQTPWGTHVLACCEVFRSATPAGIRQHFDDHQTMADLGLGSILNIPIAYDGQCVGTMNLTHVDGWYREEHEAVGLTIGAFLVPALLEHRRR
jgi:GAF domain-containing protein